MKSQPPILRLSNELIRLILDRIEPDPDKTVPVDRRQFLSIESFDFPPPSTRGSIKDIGRFRLTCRTFSEIGAPVQYTRVAARFSKNGLKKLEQLAEWPHLASHVKKFSYLVPYFYGNGIQQVRSLLQEPERTRLGFDIKAFNIKAHEQRDLVTSKEDVRILKKAIAKFASLQTVQILRVTDEDDSALLSYLRSHEDGRQFVDLEWAPACSHSSQTIGAALIAASEVPWSRFSSPMLSPQSAEFLAAHPPTQLHSLAERLTCLTLHFDDGSDLDMKMNELSSLFRRVFLSAVNMQAVHVGFPSHRPLNLPLEAVFHHVKWERLVAFGVQGWKLDAEEILGLALRHKDKLKGLRLRDVLLKDGAMWKDVLLALRDLMNRLEWVSLRRIGYARHFDDLWLVAGAEVPDDPPPGGSESDSGEEDDDDLIAGPSGSHYGQGSCSDDGGEGDEEEGTWSAASSDESDSDEEHGPDAHEMDFPPLDSPVTPQSAPWCNCNCRSFVDSVDDLEDDGYSVSNAKRRAWEKWVVRRCPEHDDRQH
ncbi:hypothetical protein K431DRAFT_307778 [Polychaeton citri CBS 116435]|uniref:Uncharacterized protein n=1 Tax=Polychaeton citri CBS 116435 TaxID=1314669 RepID=A0A9P4UJJ4_9PEZI|nr:hypothetical protein K431DRAFT_307778 [Polychaeton citri CBS 116435]